jgi:dethiobiotin synthetase
MTNYFVTGIDTDSGKTLTAAILCEALEADYWKPVQAGLPRDSDTVLSLMSNKVTRIHPEAFLLKTPASPHAAAKIDGIEITLEKFSLPATKNKLVIEGAGGCLVPLNDEAFVIDLAKKFNAQIILVADLYLGSINHTLLTIECLERRGLPIKGLIFNGISNKESEQIIIKHSKLDVLLHIKPEQTIDRSVVKTYSEKLKARWNE